MNQREDTQGHEHVENGRESERWNNGFERSAGRGPSGAPEYGYGQGGQSQDARRERGWDEHHGGEQRYGRDYGRDFGRNQYGRDYGRQPGGSQGNYGPSRAADPYGLGQRTRWREPHEHSSGEEMFGRRAFSPPEDTHYYGTGSAGYGGPGFTGGAYAYGNGPRDQERPLESEYSDESAVSYERPGYGRYPTSRSRQYAGNPYGQRSYYGTGPKGYQRSDERLKEDISERLTEAHHIDASDVSVEVRGAKVVLEGTVPSRHMKHAIEDLADACPGVQDIDNRVRVASRDELARRASQSPQQTSATAGTSGTTLSGSAGANIPGGTRSRQ